MSACGAKDSGAKPLTKKQAAVKLANGFKIVFVSVNKVKTIHKKIGQSAAASSERREFSKAKGKAEDRCKHVLEAVMKLLGDFEPSKATSPVAQQFYQEVVEQKDNYGKLKQFFNKTITPMLTEYEKSMEDYAKEGNRRAACDYASLAEQLGVHLAKAYTGIYVEHSRFGKYYFEGAGKK